MTVPAVTIQRHETVCQAPTLSIGGRVLARCPGRLELVQVWDEVTLFGDATHHNLVECDRCGARSVHTVAAGRVDTEATTA